MSEAFVLTSCLLENSKHERSCIISHVVLYTAGVIKNLTCDTLIRSHGEYEIQAEGVRRQFDDNENFYLQSVF